jgi:hypothetical protein
MNGVAIFLRAQPAAFLYVEQIEREPSHPPEGGYACLHPQLVPVSRIVRTADRPVRPRAPSGQMTGQVDFLILITGISHSL